MKSRISTILLLLGGILLAARLILGRLAAAYGLDSGMLFFWLNLLCILLLAAGAVLLIPWSRLKAKNSGPGQAASQVSSRKKLSQVLSNLGRPARAGLCTLLILVTLPLFTLAISSIWFQHWFSLSPGFNHLVMVQQERESGRTKYGMDLGIALTPLGQTSFFINGPLNFTWITNDICLISYYDSRHTPMIKVAPKMEKSLPGSIYANITGSWTSDDGSVTLSSDHGVLSYQGIVSRSYTVNSAVQFGKNTLILCNKKDEPELAIALEKDSRSSANLDTGSHISVCLIPYTTDLVTGNTAEPVTLTKISD